MTNKNILKNAIVLVLISVMLLSVAGCGSDSEKDHDRNENIPGTTETAATEAPATEPSDGTPMPASEGLEFELNDDAQSYCVVSIGNCDDAEIVIPADYNGLPVTRIEFCAFMGSRIIGAVIPEGVTELATGAFGECYSLKSVTLPSSLQRIGDLVFASCNALREITIPAGVTEIGRNVFDNCISLSSITVAEENKVYHSSENCLIETDSKTLIAGCQNSVIPNDGSVTGIGSNAFFVCTTLKSITIAGGVTSIGETAFYECTGLTSITIHDSVNVIAYMAFYNCKNLTDIHYTGTMAEWETVEKGEYWDGNIPSYTIHCTDGDITASH